jgi:hypothetical protein
MVSSWVDVKSRNRRVDDFKTPSYQPGWCMVYIQRAYTDRNVKGIYFEKFFDNIREKLP